MTPAELQELRDLDTESRSSFNRTAARGALTFYRMFRDGGLGEDPALELALFYYHITTWKSRP